MHSIKGGAGFFDLEKVRELARQTEGVLALIRSREMVPTPDRIGVLRRAAGRLHDLIQDPASSNRADISESLAALAGLSAEQNPSIGKVHDFAGEGQHGGKRLRTLVVEDDFASRLLLQSFLSRYGECHLAVNGREAVEAIITWSLLRRSVRG